MLSLDQKFGYVFSCVITGVIWSLWHIPLFFIPGTNHGEGLIDFRMFAVQCVALRFFLGAICKISGKSSIFMCVLFHTVFNAASYTFAAMTMTWKGAMAADVVIVFVSFVTVSFYNRRFGRISSGLN
ncbi:CPBP family glutamic-type intramembrane protease [Hungatella hathewayi]|uniref:CPBP family glutamic-type intramembrane protease n=2 Tax=Lachnospiraceae TaxID=186803 RepID=UPI0012F9EF39